MGLVDLSEVTTGHDDSVPVNRISPLYEKWEVSRCLQTPGCQKNAGKIPAEPAANRAAGMMRDPGGRTSGTWVWAWRVSQDVRNPRSGSGTQPLGRC